MPQSKWITFTLLIFLLICAGGLLLYLKPPSNGLVKINVNSHFVDEKVSGGTELPEKLIEIKNKVAHQINYSPSKVLLRAITPTSALITVLTHSGGNDAIYNFSTGEAIFVSNGGINSFKINKTIIYIKSNQIFYYKLGQLRFLPIVDSKLEDPFTYLTGEGDAFPTVDVTHRNDSITISVYDGREYTSIKGQNSLPSFKKVREVTYKLP